MHRRFLLVLVRGRAAKGALQERGAPQECGHRTSAAPALVRRVRAGYCCADFEPALAASIRALARQPLTWLPGQ